MNMIRKATRRSAVMACAGALALAFGLGLSSCSPANEPNASEQNATTPVAAEPAATEPRVKADDASAKNAKALLKAMSDYLAAQKVMSLSYDSVFEVVTKEHQKLQIATSGTVVAQPAGQDPHHPQVRILRYRDGL